MKKTLKSTLSIILLIIFIVCLGSCDMRNIETTTTETPITQAPVNNGPDTDNQNKNTVEKTGLWASATYLSDTEFGNGSKTLTIELKAGDQSILFTVKTDKKTVGEALLEHGLISGEESQYGLYIKSVNGIVADYDVNQSYWAFYINGEYAMSGVDTTDIVEGNTYRLEYTK